MVPEPGEDGLPLGGDHEAGHHGGDKEEEDPRHPGDDAGGGGEDGVGTLVDEGGGPGKEVLDPAPERQPETVRHLVRKTEQPVPEGGHGAAQGLQELWQPAGKTAELHGASLKEEVEHQAQEQEDQGHGEAGGGGPGEAPALLQGADGGLRQLGQQEADEEGQQHRQQEAKEQNGAGGHQGDVQQEAEETLFGHGRPPFSKSH